MHSTRLREATTIRLRPNERKLLITKMFTETKALKTNRRFIRVVRTTVKLIYLHVGTRGTNARPSHPQRTPGIFRTRLVWCKYDDFLKRLTTNTYFHPFTPHATIVCNVILYSSKKSVICLSSLWSYP